MINIRLVRKGNVLVGQSVSDRWNLRMLGIAMVGYDRNQASVKKLRRMLASEGFTLTVVRNGALSVLPTPQEADLMGRTWSCPPKGQCYRVAA